MTFPTDVKTILSYDGRLGLCNAESDTVESVVENLFRSNIDSLIDAHCFYRDKIHRRNKRYVYALTRDNTFIRYSLPWNHKHEVRVDYTKTFPTDVNCFYLCVINGIEFIETDEAKIFSNVTKYTDSDEFEFFKIFLAYQYYPGYKYFNNKFRDVDYLKDFPRDDLEKLYLELTKFFSCETYFVNRCGHRSYARMMHWIDSEKGWYDFINPKFRPSIQECANPITWTHTEDVGDGYVESVLYEDYGQIV